MTTYRERLKAGHHDATQQPTPDQAPDLDNLPGRHTPLDELAAANNIQWSTEDLSIADKQTELRAALNK